MVTLKICYPKQPLSHREKPERLHLRHSGSDNRHNLGTRGIQPVLLMKNLRTAAEIKTVL